MSINQQQGFSLVEVLVTSLLGGLLLVAAGQVFMSLVKFQAQLNNQLKLNETAILADVAIKNILTQAKSIKSAGQATSSTASSNNNLTLDLGDELGSLNFTQARNADWLLVEDKTSDNKFNLLHLDKKSHGKGLAYKSYRPDEIVAERSDTLVDLVEQIHWYFYQSANGQWLTANQVNDFSTITATSYNLLINLNSDNNQNQQPLMPTYLNLGNSFLLSEVNP